MIILPASNDFAEEAVRIRWNLAVLRRQVKQLERDLLARKAGFRPDQPRVPAGNPDGGQWTDADGNFLTDISAIRRRRPADTRRHLPDFVVPGRGTSEPRTRRQPVTIANNAQTGISTIDESTNVLVKTLEKVVNSLPDGVGPEYGKQVHYRFADAVRGLNLRGVGRDGLEHTFPEEGTWYSSKGTIRTDIVLRNDVGDVIAIYDVKTGNAYLNAARVRELRAKTGAGANVPIIEMHVLRGLSLKGRTRQPGHFWVITLRLWNP